MMIKNLKIKNKIRIFNIYIKRNNDLFVKFKKRRTVFETKDEIVVSRGWKGRI